MDMPVYIHETTAFIEGSLSNGVADYAGMVSALKKVWDLQTFNDLKDGRIAVPDDTINEYLARQLAGSDKVRTLQISTLADDRFRFTADTVSAGRVEMLCQLKGLEHNGDRSVLTVQLLNKELPDRPLMSFLFSHISMAMVVKLVGPMDVADGLQLDYHGNTVYIDFREALYNSPLGSVSLYGHNVLDAVRITGASTRPGAVVFAAALDLPDNILGMIGRALSF